MDHLNFLEKIAEGFVVEAYNGMKSREVDKIGLHAYDLPRLERAIEEMRGNEAPSARALGKSPQTYGAKGGKVAKRKLEADLEADGRLKCHEIDWSEDAEKHALIDGADAVKRGLITEARRKDSLFCSYKFCKIAAENHAQKSGMHIQGGQMQAPRAKCQAFCIHPKCMRGFHPTCWCIAHRLIDL